MPARSCTLPVRRLGDSEAADVTLIRRSFALSTGARAVAHASFEASVEPPGDNGCLLITLIVRLWRGKRDQAQLIPFFLFAHIPLRGCSDPSLFMLFLKRAVTMNFSRWKIFFPLAESNRRWESGITLRRANGGIRSPESL